jgi:hypothetical protein
VGEVSIAQAILLNRRWHSRLPESDKSNIERCTRKACYAAEFDGVFYAVAIWTDPIARLLNGRGLLELRRLAISACAPKFTASRMLRIMRALVISKFPDVVRLISYQDTSVHAGIIYKAAGWTPIETLASGNNWDTPKRSRNRPTPERIAPQKIRWEFPLCVDVAAKTLEDAECAPILTTNMELFADPVSGSD